MSLLRAQGIGRASPGTEVVVLAKDADDTFNLADAEIDEIYEIYEIYEIEARMVEAEQGELAPAESVLARLRHGRSVRG